MNSYIDKNEQPTMESDFSNPDYVNAIAVIEEEKPPSSTMDSKENTSYERLQPESTQPSIITGSDYETLDVYEN